MELPTYDFGDKVLQEGSFGETPMLPVCIHKQYTQARLRGHNLLLVPGVLSHSFARRASSK